MTTADQPVQNDEDGDDDDDEDEDGDDDDEDDEDDEDGPHILLADQIMTTNMT